jgi:hypothetical protein
LWILLDKMEVLKRVHACYVAGSEFGRVWSFQIANAHGRLPISFDGFCLCAYLGSL